MARKSHLTASINPYHPWYARWFQRIYRSRYTPAVEDQKHHSLGRRTRVRMGLVKTGIKEDYI